MPPRIYAPAPAAGGPVYQRRKAQGFHLAPDQMKRLLDSLERKSPGNRGSILSTLDQSSPPPSKPKPSVKVYGDVANYGGLIAGGGQAVLNVPVNESLTVSPYVEGGGAYGSVPTPEGKLKIRDFSVSGGGVYVNKKF